MTRSLIKFPAEIRDVGFDSILARYYLKSRIARGTVLFDLQLVKWCDPFSLIISLLTLWIRELVSLNANAAKVLAPRAGSNNQQYFYYLLTALLLPGLSLQKILFGIWYVSELLKRAEQAAKTDLLKDWANPV